MTKKEAVKKAKELIDKIAEYGSVFEMDDLGSVRHKSETVAFGLIVEPICPANILCEPYVPANDVVAIAAVLGVPEEVVTMIADAADFDTGPVKAYFKKKVMVPH